ncbi:unnamed protein product [Protopolystoma xenopodis]|uniref:Uncharacterized protein n=1 Tax=Protopolystoma xenopodis TaxID=117903 RepID=A0A448WYW7_9PLAT|nr:unnamed protein product [Protopolystoma xenopodis]
MPSRPRLATAADTSLSDEYSTKSPCALTTRSARTSSAKQAPVAGPAGPTTPGAAEVTAPTTVPQLLPISVVWQMLIRFLS